MTSSQSNSSHRRTAVPPRVRKMRANIVAGRTQTAERRRRRRTMFAVCSDSQLTRDDPLWTTPPRARLQPIDKNSVRQPARAPVASLSTFDLTNRALWRPRAVRR